MLKFFILPLATLMFSVNGFAIEKPLTDTTHLLLDINQVLNQGEPVFFLTGDHMKFDPKHDKFSIKDVSPNGVVVGPNPEQSRMPIVDLVSDLSDLNSFAVALITKDNKLYDDIFILHKPKYDQHDNVLEFSSIGLDENFDFKDSTIVLVPINHKDLKLASHVITTLNNDGATLLVRSNISKVLLKQVTSSVKSDIGDGSTSLLEYVLAHQGPLQSFGLAAQSIVASIMVDDLP